MNLQGVKDGDIVRIDKKGRIFLAEVTGKERGKIRVSPITNGITYHEASAREIVAHWRKSRTSQ